MTQAFKISLPGVDVKTARPDQCVVHSDYANPKINKHANPAHRGLLQLVLNGTYKGDNTVFSFPHGYSYTPMVWATIAEVNTANPNIFGFTPYISGTNSVDVKTDTANVYFIVHGNPLVGWTPLITLNISYAIFADNGAHV